MTSRTLDPALAAAVQPILDRLADEIGRARIEDVVLHAGHANELVELGLDDGRRLMIKRARVPESAPSFTSARVASELIRDRTDLLAPAHLDVPEAVDGLPVLVYWRIPLPTLSDAWQEMDDADRVHAMRSWGALAARLHTIRLPGHGPLERAAREPVRFGDYAEARIETYFAPTFSRDWPAGLQALAALRRALPAIRDSIGTDGGTLVHNDLYMANVLCEGEGPKLRCSGLLDLEAAYAGPPEADIARPVILYGPGFGDLPEHLVSALFDGYDGHLEPVRLDFFRAWHLLNIGLHCARRDLDEFASHLATGAEEIAAGIG